METPMPAIPGLLASAYQTPPSNPRSRRAATSPVPRSPRDAAAVPTRPAAVSARRRDAAAARTPTRRDETRDATAVPPCCRLCAPAGRSPREDAEPTRIAAAVPPRYRLRAATRRSRREDAEPTRSRLTRASMGRSPREDADPTRRRLARGSTGRSCREDADPTRGATADAPTPPRDTEPTRCRNRLSLGSKPPPSPRPARRRRPGPAPLPTPLTSARSHRLAAAPRPWHSLRARSASLTRAYRRAAPPWLRSAAGSCRPPPRDRRRPARRWLQRTRSADPQGVHRAPGLRGCRRRHPALLLPQPALHHQELQHVPRRG
ncbi:hypothetical protein BS78_K193700 [Paspalum vaginatum]|uniref:Uncharacterized protein n=1 Tax=Paspalum vaginatum TaxID=158149 RepID=A0A9W7XF42_9POAL|nr:hypothetical protein BS78_K193700 [Paspalum vaginatum]